MNSLHSSGKTTSPDTVSPIGLQPPGGVSSSFGDDCAAVGLGSAELPVWASATPFIRSRTAQHSKKAGRARNSWGLWRLDKRFIGSLNQLSGECSSTPFRQVYERKPLTFALPYPR